MPERPDRIEACLEAIDASDLSYTKVEPQPASPQDLARVHSREYLQRLSDLCEGGGGWLDPDTPATPGSFEVAARAAGACCKAVDMALADGAQSFCLTRPPGHHASADQAMGFCLINSVAVGAGRALDKGADRVLILDFDVHHGNGTQEIFWTDPNVFYLSVHQWPWYPWTTGSAEETGGGAGEGANMNIPMPAGSTDADYQRAFEEAVVPAAHKFSPDLLLVSAGFDAHAADPLSEQQVSSDGFHSMARTIRSLADQVCQGRLVIVLEGGYNRAALAQSVVATLSAL